ncbi:DUF3099 domain-containing protein [Agromyces intestinalis]|uniref:DUF3099 domain-containing protein n=1 Tax=Agromyces intestinalis TaxID=2592652 RepID=A0A5C1YJ16_9MICO|nr:DUF3099 domain-containing protein [Agromyces intestinalis]QEO15961.1 DUF3099 domain-containing protein [Agromyces intestinalis]
MKSQQHTITSLPPSPEEERRARMVKYTIAMSIRVVCIVLMLFVQGWWLAVFAAGAIFLPYIAVVLANVGSQRGGEVAAPTLALTDGRPAPAHEADAAADADPAAPAEPGAAL